jgi:hypothetical protein
MAIFFRRGKSAAIFALTVASPAAPTVAEITAGTDLSKAIAQLAGFETNPNIINQAVMAYDTEIQISGPRQSPGPSMTLIEGDGVSGGDETSYAAALTALAEGTSGYLILSPRKASPLTATTKCEVWPVTVGAVNRDWSLDAQAARYTVNLVMSSQPTKNAVVAA